MRQLAEARNFEPIRQSPLTAKKYGGASMADPLRFHPLVAEDIRLASQWYDEISVDLGNRFRRAVDSRLDTVELRPESFGRVQEELRAARVEGFPYIVIYRIERQATEDLGIFHAAEDPQKWRSRAR